MDSYLNVIRYDSWDSDGNKIEVYNELLDKYHDELVNKYGTDDGELVFTHLVLMMAEVGDDSIDSIRIANMRNRKEVSIYKSVRKSSSREAHDEFITNNKNGNRFMLGCNYGR